MKKEGQNRKKESGRRLYTVFIIIFSVGLIVCLVWMVRDYRNQKKAEEQFEALAALSEEPETAVPEEGELGESTQQIEVPEKNLDWDVLAEENEDIYAWIYIPGTQVDYPILQHPTEDDYYLNHNLDGSSGYPGCIYTQRLNGKEFGDANTVIYGHNMGNGTMFGSLHEYEDNTFFEENPYVYIYTPNETLVYEIFAACTFSDAHLLYSYDCTLETDFNAYVEDLKGVRDMNSHVRPEVEICYGDHLLTLSTCIKNQPTQRWIVAAVLLNK